MRESFTKQLLELAERDPRITLLTADLGFRVLDEFAARLPRQYINVGIAEQNLTGLATGLALEGRIVFTYSIANFPTLRCLEQIRNDACYHDAAVKVVAVGGGFSYGALGISHHATEDLSIMRALPNITVVAPGDRWEAVQATAALARSPGPAYLRLDRSSASAVDTDGAFQLGRGRIVRQGEDFTIVACGGILEEALRAACILHQRGIEIRVVSMHTLKPLDADLLAHCARQTGGIASLEEHTVEGGLGSAIAEALLERDCVPRAFLRFGLRAGFSCAVGSQAYLRRHYGIDGETVAGQIEQRLLERRFPRRAFA